MLEKYREHVAERAAQGIPPLPLDVEQTQALVALIQSPPQGEDDVLLSLLTDRVPAGVDPASHVKAGLLSARFATGRRRRWRSAPQRPVTSF